MPSLESLSVAVPPHQTGIAEIPDIAGAWLTKDRELADKFRRLSSNSGVEKRNLILPWRDILQLGGLSERAGMFMELGEPLLRRAVTDCLDNSLYKKESLSHFLFFSCSVPVIPSIDARLILNAGLSGRMKRLPVFQHGCAGGVAGLALGAEFARLGSPVLVTSLELCSLVFQYDDRRASQLVGASIFADGAAAALISPGRGELNFIDSMSWLIPGSGEMMGYDLCDDGFHLKLDPGLPSLLVREMPAALKMFLAKNGTGIGEVEYFLFHPGGRKILDFFEEELGVGPDRCGWAREVLRDYGNMSSATIFFVLERFREQVKLRPGQKALVAGVGPGMTLEFILFQG